jgi:hypothetical protein
MKKQKYDRFDGRGVYICADCGRRTRTTDPDAAAVGLCTFCYNIALEENERSDSAPANSEAEEPKS